MDSAGCTKKLGLVHTKKHFLDLKRVLFTSWKLAMFTNKQNIEFTIPAVALA